MSGVENEPYHIKFFSIIDLYWLNKAILLKIPKIEKKSQKFE